MTHNFCKTRSFTVIIVTLLAAAIPLLAGNGGSIYSRFGLGDIRYGYSAQTMGMGSTGLALLSNTNIDINNPAAWANIARTRYTVGALYEGYSTTDGLSSTFLSAADFNGAMIAIPVAPKSGVVFGAGITPFSRINYNTVSTYTQSNLSYTLRFLGNGGLSQAHMGISATLVDEFHVGLKLNYYFGTLHHTVQQNFTSSQYTNAEVIRSTQLRGTGVSFGFVYTGLTHVLHLSEGERFSIGGFISSATSLSSEDEAFLSYAAGSLTTRDTSTLSEGETHLPFALGAGVSYTTERALLAADIYYQNWNAFTVYGIHSQELRDSYRFSVGGELIPKRDPSAPLTQRIAYRAGVFYHQTYYRINNQPINEIGLSGGFGVPIFGDTRFHIAAEYALRGTTDNQLQKDKILRLSFTLTGGELWFVRPTEE